MHYIHVSYCETLAASLRIIFFIYSTISPPPSPPFACSMRASNFRSKSGVLIWDSWEGPRGANAGANAGANPGARGARGPIGVGGVLGVVGVDGDPTLIGECPPLPSLL
jgi:hypothetical protein